MGKNSAQSKPQSKNRYKGVRLRPSGKWSAEIRDPTEGRTWIGSYCTAEEACRAYDLRAREIGFPNAKLNFPEETPAPPSQKGHPAKAKKRAQLPDQESLENVQPNSVVQQDSTSNGLNSNPIDLDLKNEFITVNGNLDDSCYWSVLHQEQNGPNAPYIPYVEPKNVQQKNIVQEEDSSNNLNNNSVDRDHLYSLIGSENIDLSVLGSAMKDGRKTPAIPSVDAQHPEYSLRVRAGDLEESSGWYFFEMETEMPGAAEYDQRWRKFDHPANGDASEFVESERSLEKKIEKQKPERENGIREGLEFGGIFYESKDNKKRTNEIEKRQEKESEVTMKADEGGMKMEDEELERKVDIEARKVGIEERKVFLQQRRIAVDEEMIKLQREKKEIDIMTMDVSTMNEVQKKNIESLQNEIFSRRMAM